MVEDWTDHPGYLAFHDWILDNVDYLGMEASEAIVEGLARKGMPPPSIAAMSALAKWASVTSDNVELLRGDPDLREELKRYTEDWGLDRLEGWGGADSVYEVGIYRALRLKMDFDDALGIISGESDLEIYQMEAESWSVELESAEGFLHLPESGAVLFQPKPAPGSLIWNFMNPVLGYDAFQSRFESEREVILESQCARCPFEEIFQMRLPNGLRGGREGVARLESALEGRGYRLNEGEYEEGDLLIMEFYHRSKSYSYWLPG